MSCPECDDERRVLIKWFVDEFTEARGHFTVDKEKMVDCPECGHRCLSCHGAIWELEAQGMVTLRDECGEDHWCDVDCLAAWLTINNRILKPAGLVAVTEAERIYLYNCGCKGEHSEQCVETRNQFIVLKNATQDHQPGHGVRRGV